MLIEDPADLRHTLQHHFMNRRCLAKTAQPHNIQRLMKILHTRNNLDFSACKSACLEPLIDLVQYRSSFRLRCEQPGKEQGQLWRQTVAGMESKQPPAFSEDSRKIGVCGGRAFTVVSTIKLSVFEGKLVLGIGRNKRNIERAVLLAVSIKSAVTSSPTICFTTGLQRIVKSPWPQPISSTLFPGTSPATSSANIASASGPVIVEFQGYVYFPVAPPSPAYHSNECGSLQSGCSVGSANSGSFHLLLSSS